MSKNSNDKKVGRKPTEAQKITPDDINNLKEGLTTPKDVAQIRGIKRQTVDNKLHRLKVEFENKQADPNITSQNTLKDSQGLPPQNTMPLQDNGVPLDATEAIKGMLQFIDLGLRMSDTLSKGRIEYEGCSDEELTNCAKVTNTSAIARRIATQEGLSALIIVGTLVGTFGKHLKYHPPLKHKPNDENCKCQRCEQKNKDLEAIQKLGVIKKNSEINDVPPDVLPTPTEVIDQNTKDSIKDRAEEIVQDHKEQSRFDDQFIATKEYKLPDVD